jgi:hypothetical protein
VKYESYSYPCGHTRRHTPQNIERLRREQPDRCWDCEYARRSAELPAAAKAARSEADAALAAITIPDAVPGPLAQEWRWWAAKNIQGAIALERVAGKTGAAGSAVQAATAELHRLAAVMADPQAAADKGVLQLAGQGHWAAGWAHLACTHPVSPDELRAAASLAAQLTEAAAAPGALAEYPTAAATAILTGLITALPDRTRPKYATDPRYWVYRELRLPVVPDGKSRYGRLDVVIWHPGYPDVVVEIDSAPNPASAQKLAFARDAGACPVWIRHGSGGITAPEGVAVIDLR